MIDPCDSRITTVRGVPAPNASLVVVPISLPLAKNPTAVTHPLESPASAASSILGRDRKDAPLVGVTHVACGGAFV